MLKDIALVLLIQSCSATKPRYMTGQESSDGKKIGIVDSEVLPFRNAVQFINGEEADLFLERRVAKDSFEFRIQSLLGTEEYMSVVSGSYLIPDSGILYTSQVSDLVFRGSETGVPSGECWHQPTLASIQGHHWQYLPIVTPLAS